ncbi:MAG: type II toxin-antitoxin system VapB family antitoxin [Candidatus Binataceae bacterium]
MKVTGGRSLNIKDQRTHELARRLAAATGETLTEAVRIALKERLRRIETLRSGESLADRLDEIAFHCASLPKRRERSEDEILGYNERGLPD